MSVRTLFTGGIAVAVLALPEAASACAVCASGGEESRSAFIWTTVLLSVLPPAMVGGVVWWIWRAHRERAEGPQASAGRKAAAPGAPAGRS